MPGRKRKEYALEEPPPARRGRTSKGKRVKETSQPSAPAVPGKRSLKGCEALVPEEPPPTRRRLEQWIAEDFNVEVHARGCISGEIILTDEEHKLLSWLLEAEGVGLEPVSEGEEDQKEAEQVAEDSEEQKEKEQRKKDQQEVEEMLLEFDGWFDPERPTYDPYLAARYGCNACPCSD
mmetsp:Transcript_60101/g.134071  ORF Transcript_60101/g.134071 Transcript_60101/m.134071 type:complete len:178 (+) Transcript_60101:36-569(+)